MAQEGEIIRKVCEAISEGDEALSEKIIGNEYPHISVVRNGRKYTKLQSTKIFIRDGFIDRYSGKRLVFPAVLRVLSKLMPTTFPYHRNWKMTDCHISYWQLFPTIDHVVPVARGGDDQESNCVSTSMLRNSAKSNWLLEELGWEIHPKGKVEDWDGLINWFIEYATKSSSILSDAYINKWYKAGIKAIKT